jgi:hypothetical protein
MALEYRKYYPVVDQQAPEGSTGIGDFDGGIVWAGEAATFDAVTYRSEVMSVQDVAMLYGAHLKAETFQHIENYMPQWRMARWRRYYDLRNKVLSKAELNEVEKAEYDCFPDPIETHEDCDKYVSLALLWCSLCVVEHNRVYFGMLAAKSIEEILKTKDSISYPKFIL